MSDKPRRFWQIHLSSLITVQLDEWKFGHEIEQNIKVESMKRGYGFTTATDGTPSEMYTRSIYLAVSRLSWFLCS